MQGRLLAGNHIPAVGLVQGVVAKVLFVHTLIQRLGLFIDLFKILCKVPQETFRKCRLPSCNNQGVPPRPQNGKLWKKPPEVVQIGLWIRLNPTSCFSLNMNQPRCRLVCRSEAKLELSGTALAVGLSLPRSNSPTARPLSFKKSSSFWEVSWRTKFIFDRSARPRRYSFEALSTQNCDPEVWR